MTSIIYLWYVLPAQVFYLTRFWFLGRYPFSSRKESEDSQEQVTSKVKLFSLFLFTKQIHKNTAKTLNTQHTKTKTKTKTTRKHTRSPKQNKTKTKTSRKHTRVHQTKKKKNFTKTYTITKKKKQKKSLRKLWLRNSRTRKHNAKRKPTITSKINLYVVWLFAIN